jgi:ubiquinone/menaquinone biosynthesis C-methylase UbiE
MRHILSKPILSIKPDRLAAKEIASDDLKKWFPRYLTDPTTLDCGPIKYAWLWFVQWLLKLGVEIFLRPRKENVGDLGVKEVEKVYDREAASYDLKHHITTHGVDTTWRRLAGWCATIFAREHDGPLTILDICTGTGLTIVEMAKVLSAWGIKSAIIGLDYNQKMLDVAHRRHLDYPGSSISFVRGDAMNLSPVEQNDGMEHFALNSIDVATQMFGIGGISDPLAVFRGVLQSLKPGGQYFLVDMHQPIAEQPGEWPFLLKWFQFPQLEAATYNESTIPVVLNRLWGWRDTTLDFYQLPLITWQDAIGGKWGFRVTSFEVESQRWWLGLPIMPVGKIIVEKVSISDEEFIRRQNLLSVII